MTIKQRHRKIPLLGEIALFPLTLLFVLLHVVCSPFGQEVKAATVLLVFGGFFAFSLLPFPLVYGILYTIDDVLGYCDKSVLFYGIVLPFAVIYCLYLMIDTTHLQVVNSGPIPPRNWFEEVAWKMADCWLGCLELSSPSAYSG